LLEREGKKEDEVCQDIHTYAHHAVPMVSDIHPVPARPAPFTNRHAMLITRSPKDIEIVVAGGRTGDSSVIFPWALHGDGIVERVLII